MSPSLSLSITFATLRKVTTLRRFDGSRKQFGHNALSRICLVLLTNSSFDKPTSRAKFLLSRQSLSHRGALGTLLSQVCPVRLPSFSFLDPNSRKNPTLRTVTVPRKCSGHTTGPSLFGTVSALLLSQEICYSSYHCCFTEVPRADRRAKSVGYCC